MGKRLDLGIKSGLANKILCGFVLGGISGDVGLKGNSEKLLDQLGEEMVNLTDYTFNTGLTGIGWMIEYCAQQSFLDINTDDVLEDLDDNCYKRTLINLSNKFYDIDELLGLTIYHLIRSKSKNVGTHYYRQFIHIECVKLLARHLNKYLTENLKKIENGKSLSMDKLNDITKVMLKISHLVGQTKLEKIFEKTFYATIDNFSSFYQNILSGECSENTEIAMHRSICFNLLMVVTQYDHPIWVAEFESYFNRLNEIQINLDGSYNEKQKILEEMFNNSKIANSKLPYWLNLAKGRELLSFFLSNYSLFKVTPTF